MEYMLKNDQLSLTVSSAGAEMTSLVQNGTGRQLLWQADPAVWGRHAPMLFPYTGRIKHGKFTWEGKEYQGGQHGFGRDQEFELAEQTDTLLDLVTRSNADTLARFPFDFVLHSIFTLEGSTVTHTIRVENPGTGRLRFGFGYHPGFICPFDAQHDTEDYELRFDAPQTPIVVETQFDGEFAGLVTGRQWPMMEHSAVIPLTDHTFDHDSICMSQLTAKTLSLVEKDTGRGVTLDIEGFPYVLIWSAPTPKLHYVCVEPWHTLPDTFEATGDWGDKPCAADLAPGESWQTSLPMHFKL